MSTYESLGRMAWRRRGERTLPEGALALAVGALVGLDQAAKVWVELNLPLHSVLPLWGDSLRLVHYANRGAVGGVGEELPWLVSVLALAGALLILALLAAYRFYRGRYVASWRVQSFVVFAVAALLCTLLDRVRLGYVLDFVHFAGLPVFNIGDLLPNFAVVFLAMEVVAVVKRS